MKILVIDGQGGRLGRQIIEGLKPYTADHELIAVGTNVLATSAMLKAYHVGRSRAHQLLIPVNRCNHEIIGVANCTMSELVSQTIQRARQLLQ